VAEPLDRATLAELLAAVGDDPAFVGELVDTFLADAPAQLDAIDAAIAAGSAEQLVRPAHTLKGNSLNLGAVELAALGRMLEEQARAGVLDGAATRAAAARGELGRVRAALETARAEGWRP
jgi:HPt (histidine-containing phosphotransfer) domain-containing protein